MAKVPEARVRERKNGGQNSSVNYIDLFKDQPYYNDADFQRLAQSYQDFADRFNSRQANANPTIGYITGFVDTFKQQFRNYVGRDPNEAELNQLFKSINNWNPAAREANAFGTEFPERSKALIQDYYTRTAAEEAQKKSEGQVSQALAPNSAFDVWQNAYRKNVTDTEQALNDYQTKLFEKIRPQLLTSLQSQGLLNTGALNEAFAGVSKDLTDEAQKYVLGARSAAESDIANRRYDIASAPSNYGLQNTFSAVPNLTVAGQNALQNVWNSYLQDQAFQNNSRLLEQQQSQKPSLLSQYGGLILGGVASGIGQRLGSGFGRQRNPYANTYANT